MNDYRHHDWAAETEFGRYLSRAEHDLVVRGHAMSGAPGLVLDVGAAGGRWSLLLQHQGWNNIITDVNALSIERCRELMPDAVCHLVDPYEHRLPAANRSLDMILCVEVFAVVGEPWFTAEAERTMKPGGLLVGEFNNKWSWRGMLHHALKGARGRGLDYYARAYPQWKAGLEKTGFKMEFEEGLGWTPFGRHSNSSLIKSAVKLEKALGLRNLISLSPTVTFIARRLNDQLSV